MTENQRPTGWVIQYVYETETGEQGVSILNVTARSKEEASQLAIENAAVKEYIFTVYPESDEQHLGTVKHDAHRMAHPDKVLGMDDIEE